MVTGVPADPIIYTKPFSPSQFAPLIETDTVHNSQTYVYTFTPTSSLRFTEEQPGRQLLTVVHTVIPTDV